MPGFVFLILDVALALPGVALAAVGLVLSLTSRRRLGRASAPMLVAFILLLVAAVLAGCQMIVSFFGPELVAKTHWSYGTLSMVLGSGGAVHTLISTVGWVLLLIAIFRRRETGRPGAGAAFPAAGSVAGEGIPATVPGRPGGPAAGSGQQPGVPSAGAGQQFGAPATGSGQYGAPATGPGQQLGGPATGSPQQLGGPATGSGPQAGTRPGQQPSGWPNPGNEQPTPQSGAGEPPATGGQQPGGWSAPSGPSPY